MQRVDGFYLYELGHRIHAIEDIVIFQGGDRPLHNCKEARAVLYPAKHALDMFLERSIYRIRTLQTVGRELSNLLQWALDYCEEEERADEFPKTDMMFLVQEKLREFEAVLKAEMANSDLYYLQQKSAFDTNTLVECGELAFQSELPDKVPEAVLDIREAMKCIAFDLPTGAAFHLHRANEIVLGQYWDAVSNGKKRPKNQTLGSYIGELEKQGYGTPHVISALKDIKNLHRNPTMHADQSLESTEEAIDLQGAVRSAVGAMMKAIPKLDQAQEGTSMSSLAELMAGFNTEETS